MEITYHGTSCIRLRGREAQVVIDPPANGPASKLGPDIVVRTDKPTDSGLLRPKAGKAQEVAGPGEFEVKGVAIRGLAAGNTTIMQVEIDDVRVVSVGALTKPMTEDQIDTLGHVDVLILPVGGGDSLSPTDATKLARAIEPAIVIPLRFSGDDLTEAGGPVEGFTKEMGVTGPVTAQPKLNLTGAMPNAEETRVVVLEART